MSKLKWSVVSIDVDCGSPYITPEITVTLSGMLDRLTISPKTIDELHKELMFKLNGADGYPFDIKNVIVNEPATIVFWSDGTKTVVKCQEGDVFDPEKGLTMAIVKKLYGNKGSYCDKIKKWTEPWYEKQRSSEQKSSEYKISAYPASGYIPATEHYVLGYLYNPDNIMGNPEYYVVHVEHTDLADNHETRNQLFHSASRERAMEVARGAEFSCYGPNAPQPNPDIMQQIREQLD